MNISPIVHFATACCFGIGLTVSAAEKQTPRSQKAQAKPAVPADTRLDLNTADVKALEAVPVIGTEVARAIVAARPFATIDELDRLKGLSAERLEQIRAVVTVATLHTPAKVGMPTVDTRQSRTGGGRQTEKVDLNTADFKTLEAMPGIGAETATAIVAARPFATIDDLSRVKGISAERLEQIRTQVTVAPKKSPVKIPAP